MTGPINQQIQILNTPSKPQTDGVAKGRSQKDRRYTDTFFDQHKHSGRFPRGRPWCGERELAANRESTPPPADGFCMPDLMRGEYVTDETGLMCDRGASLASAWDAPWTPLAKYFKFNYARKTITFEYAKMRAEEERSLEEYYEAAAILGADLNVAVEYGVLPSFQIRAKIGNPTKYLKIVEAAMAGDPWLLGFIDEPNPELAAILGFNQRGMRITSYTPEPVAIVTPQQVLATPANEMSKMIAEAVALALKAERDTIAAQQAAKKQADAARMEKVRAARGRAGQGTAA